MDATSQMKEGAFFKDTVQNIVDKQSGETVYYLHPTAEMTKKEGDNSTYAASSITCLDASNRVGDVMSFQSILKEDKNLRSILLG